MTTAETMVLIPQIPCARQRRQYACYPHRLPHEFLMIQYGWFPSLRIEKPLAPYPTSRTPWLSHFLPQISGHETPPMYVCMNIAFNPTAHCCISHSLFFQNQWLQSKIAELSMTKQSYDNFSYIISI